MIYVAVALVSAPASAADTRAAVAAEVRTACGISSPAEFDALAPARREQALPCILEIAARHAGKGLPERINEELSIQQVAAEGKSLRFTFQVEGGTARLWGMWPSVVSDHMRKRTCSDPDLARLVRQGATIVYRFTNPGGEAPAEAVVTHCSAD